MDPGRCTCDKYSQFHVFSHSAVPVACGVVQTIGGYERLVFTCANVGGGRSGTAHTKEKV